MSDKTLFVSDLDGTLLDNNCKVSEVAVEFFAENASDVGGGGNSRFSTTSLLSEWRGGCHRKVEILRCYCKLIA